MDLEKKSNELIPQEPLQEWTRLADSVKDRVRENLLGFESSKGEEMLSRFRVLYRVLERADAYLGLFKRFARLREEFERVGRVVRRVRRRIDAYRTKEEKYARVLSEYACEEKNEAVPGETACDASRVDITALEAKELQQIVDGLTRGSELLKTRWQESSFEKEMDAFARGMESLLQMTTEMVEYKERACENALRVVQRKEDMLEAVKEDLVARVLYLRKRKACIEEELRVMENRKRISFLKKRVVSSRVGKDDEVVSLNVEEESEVDSLPSKRMKTDKKVEFHFNPETGCFEERAVE